MVGLTKTVEPEVVVLGIEVAGAWIVRLVVGVVEVLVVFIIAVGMMTLCVSPKSLSRVVITQVKISISSLRINRYKYFGL